MPTSKRPHNDETKRLAKAFNFNGRDLALNAQGNLTPQQQIATRAKIRGELISGGGIAFVYLVVAPAILLVLDYFQVFDFSTVIQRSTIIGGMLFYAWGGGIIGLLYAIYIAIQAYRNSLAVYVGRVKIDKGKTVKFGDINIKLEEHQKDIFREEFEYTIYHLNKLDLMYSVEASDPRFYQRH